MPAGSAAVKKIETEIKKVGFSGGCDNIPGLLRAWDLAAGRPDSLVLWIHGPQPVLIQTPEVLLQYVERRPGKVKVVSLDTDRGPNRILEELRRVPAIQAVPRMSTPRADLESLFATWKPGETGLVATRIRVPAASEQGLDPAGRTWSHLAKLWAFDEVNRLALSRSKEDHEKAVRLAMQYHLVTPLTGAVVLETAQQYKDAGLNPVDPSKVPTVPEPETWLLIFAALVMILWAEKKRRDQCTAASA
jgi:hypothetical protein